MIDDATLMAYLDCELDAQGQLEVEKRLATSPEARSRLEQHRVLNGKLSATFDGVLQEPVPDRIDALIRQGGAETSARSVADVVDLSAIRAPRTRRVAFSWRLPTGLAACLVVGLFAGLGINFLRPSSTIVAGANGLIAQAGLSHALDSQLALTQDPRSPIRVGLTVRAGDGRYCRTFRTATLAGLACREPAAWTVRLITTARAEREAAYRTAASDMPAAVLQAVQDLDSGSALDAKAEEAARRRNWRP